MKSLRDQHRPFGNTGLVAPSVVFCTAPLGNVERVIPDQTKLAICREWFQHVAPPVFMSAAYKHGDRLALESLVRMLRRLDVSADEVVVHLTLDSKGVIEGFEKGCQLLGNEYRPKLVSICSADESAWHAVSELKSAGVVLGAGIATNDLRALKGRSPAVDWVMLAGGFTLMRHPPDRLAFMCELAERQIPILVSGVFDGGFLVGSNRLDGRVLNADEPSDRSLLAWRTSFAALCHGHGVTPAHACIQFALSGPGVVAVEVNSSHPDRVAENVDCAQRKVRDAFWASMKEEGLLAGDYPYL